MPLEELEHDLTVVIGQLAAIHHDSDIDLDEQMEALCAIRAKLSHIANPTNDGTNAPITNTCLHLERKSGRSESVL